LSRLDSFIRRLEAQRLCLDWATARIAATPGVVLELGLGNGRTYDHLASRLGPGREIHAFARRVVSSSPSRMRISDPEMSRRPPRSPPGSGRSFPRCCRRAGWSCRIRP